jgi:hypothetical protein
MDVLICDTRDARAAESLRAKGLRVECRQTIMRTADDKMALARAALSAVRAAEPPDGEPQAHGFPFRRLDNQP